MKSQLLMISNSKNNLETLISLKPRNNQIGVTKKLQNSIEFLKHYLKNNNLLEIFLHYKSIDKFYF